MSTLKVVNLQNPASSVINGALNADGSTTFGGAVNFASGSTLSPSSGTTAPTSPVVGSLWYDTNTVPPILKAWDGGAWVSTGSGTVATLAQAAVGTSATLLSTPSTAVPKSSADMLGAAILPSGTTAQQPTTLLAGMTRFNTTTADLEFYTGSAWNGATAKVLGAGAGATYNVGASVLPSGTTAQRPTTPATGMLRVNTTTNSPESYINGSWSPIQSTQSGQFAGLRNILINGNFSVNQRQYVSGTATSFAGEYTLDRWNVVTSGQSVTFTASGNGNQVTAPAGGLEQLIENINIDGGVYTLSWTGTATATVNGTAVANGGQVTLPANTQASVVFSGGTVSQAQLEPGSVASPFEERTYPLELLLCQRYCYAIVTRPATGGNNTSDWLPFQVGGVNFSGSSRVLALSGTSTAFSLLRNGTMTVIVNSPINNGANEVTTYPAAGQWAYFYRAQGSGFYGPTGTSWSWDANNFASIGVFNTNNFGSSIGPTLLLVGGNTTGGRTMVIYDVEL